MSEGSDIKIRLSEPALHGREWELVKECLDTGWLSAAGRFVGEFESRICDITGAGHAVGCMNGTSALHLALVISGIGPGDEVIVPTLTFIAPVNAIRYTGAEPVFVGCDEYLNIDVDALAAFLAEECTHVGDALVNNTSGRRVRAIIPVHVLGSPCRMAEVMALAESYGLTVIEDASEGLGSAYSGGTLSGSHVGTIADIGVLSFNTNKIITTGGGGMLLLKDEESAQEARYLGSQAKDDALRYRHDHVGYNYRLTNIEAAIGVAQLDDLRQRVESRRRIHAMYEDGLGTLDGVRVIGYPPDTAPNAWMSAIWVDAPVFGMDVEALMGHMGGRGIEVRPVWRPNHMQVPYYRCQAYRIERAAQAASAVLCLPSGSGLEAGDIEYVIDSIKEAQKRT